MAKPTEKGTFPGQWVSLLDQTNWLWNGKKWEQTDDQMNVIEKSQDVSKNLDSGFWTEVVKQGGGLTNNLFGLFGKNTQPTADVIPTADVPTRTIPRNTMIYIGVGVVALVVFILLIVKSKKQAE